MCKASVSLKCQRWRGWQASVAWAAGGAILPYLTSKIGLVRIYQNIHLTYTYTSIIHEYPLNAEFIFGLIYSLLSREVNALPSWLFSGNNLTGSSSAPDNKPWLCQVLSSIVTYNGTQWPCSTQPVPRRLSNDSVTQRKALREPTDIKMIVCIACIICFFKSCSTGACEEIPVSAPSMQTEEQPLELERREIQSGLEAIKKSPKLLLFWQYSYCYSY